MNAGAGLTNLGMIEHARRVTAVNEYDIEARFPSVIERADGAWLYDVEGNKLLDLSAADATVLLGYRHPAVTEAVIAQLRDCGNGFASTISPVRVELAERLGQRYPCAEKVVFGKTGSEATTMAIRLARAATGRRIILSSGYHGWHEWQEPYLSLGFDAAHEVVWFGYRETALARLLDEFSGAVAGVMVTPELLYFDLDYYRRMSDLCRRHDVPFMLDEVFTGFRAGSRGVHGSGEVPADVVAISKGLANGHPISAVMGRRDIIDAYDAAGLAGTYNRETPPMAAALATLDVIADGSVHEHCERMGRRLMTGVGEILAAAQIPALIDGPPMMFDVVLASDELSWQIYQACHQFGVYCDESGNPLVTAAFDDSAVDFALTAFDKAVRQVAAAGDLDREDITDEFRLDFAETAFGGYLRDDERTNLLVEKAIGDVARHLGR